MTNQFNRGDYVKVSGYAILGRVYKVFANEYQIAMYDRKDLWADGTPAFDFGSRQIVVKEDRLTAAGAAV